MKITFVPLPEFDDPWHLCILCENNSKAQEYNKLLGGYICSICIEEAINEINLVFPIKMSNKDTRKAMNQFGRKVELQFLYDDEPTKIL